MTVCEETYAVASGVSEKGKPANAGNIMFGYERFTTQRLSFGKRGVDIVR